MQTSTTTATDPVLTLTTTEPEQARLVLWCGEWDTPFGYWPDDDRDAALDAAGQLEQLATDPSVALPVREALRVRPGAVQLHERARALDLRVAEASTLRRGDGQIVAGVEP